MCVYSLRIPMQKVKKMISFAFSLPRLSGSKRWEKDALVSTVPIATLSKTKKKKIIKNWH